MDTKILEEIGLTKSEIKVYLALVKLGSNTTTHIVREAEVHPSKVYDILDKLIAKNLVSYTIRSGKKYFSATDPSSIKEFLNEKQNKLKEQIKEVDKLIPELNLIKKQEKEAIKSETYEGLGGIKTIYSEILATLKKNEVQYVIGAPRIGNERIEGFLIDWHKKRIKKGIKCKYIYDSNVKDYGKIREKMPLTEVRYLPNNIVSPVWIEIFKEFVVIGHIKNYNAILFLIQDEEIAKGYIDYFNLLWKISKK